MDKLFDHLKQFITIAGFIGVLIAGYTGFVTGVGGRVVPWATPDEVKIIVTEEISGLVDAANAMECEDYKDRRKRARAAIERDANDMVAADGLEAHNARIASIPGCM